MSSAWSKFIRQLEEGDGFLSRFFQGAISLVTGFVDMLTMANKSITEIRENARLKEISGDIKQDQQEINKVAQELYLSYREQGYELSKNEAKLKAAKMVLESIIKQSKKEWSSGDNIDARRRAIEQIIKNIKSSTDATKEFVREQQKLVNWLTLGFDTQNAASKQSIEYYEQLIKKLKETQRTIPQSSEQYQILGKEIEKVEKFLKGLIRELEGEDKDYLEFLDKTDQLEKFAKTIRNTGDDIDDLKDKISELKGMDILKGELFDLASMMNIDAGKIEDFFNEYESSALSAGFATSEVLGGIGQTMYENELTRIDNQLQANRRRYNQEIQLAQGNQEQQEALRREQEQREQELLARRAKAERQNALFQIAINTVASTD